jgi:hypothetical protein
MAPTAPDALGKLNYITLKNGTHRTKHTGYSQLHHTQKK